WDEDLWPSFNPNWDSFPQSSGLDIYETDDKVVIEAQVPGIPEDKVEMFIEGNVLTIEASMEETEEQKGAKKAVYRETRQRSFHYSVNLPRGVNAEKAEAEVVNGILKVTIPVAEEEKRKRIEVKSKK
ncbi:Hsp20/alpha crystallin family protein, partial [Patescibacteria group bacterium]|nr:Hsp20/alpha crystallin family protein [Patescibacteria group bacterium]